MDALLGSSQLSTWSSRLSVSQYLIGPVILVVLASWIHGLLKSQSSNEFPFINSSKSQFVKNARQILKEGSQKFTGAYNLLTENGTLIMLPPDYIDAINAQENLSLQKFAEEEFLTHFETFRPMRAPPPGMLEEAALKGITRALPKYTKPLSLEMSASLRDTWGDQQEWRQVKILEDAGIWVARQSSCVFLPDRFKNDKNWIRITTRFTVNMFMAIFVTRLFHPLLRPFVDFLSPLNRRVRSDYAKAAAMLEPVFQERDKEILAARQEGRKPNLPNDSIEWFRSAAHGQAYDPVQMQMTLTVAAIHTTSDLLSASVLNFCAYPEYQEPLRREAIEVLSKHGLQKTALTELHLLDSFFKETQRLKPAGMSSMHRSATADVQLPGGINIKKGERLAISAGRMWDERVYTDADTFNAFRFAERRKMPGLEYKSSLVATSPEHLGFAHGKHACPGRFFAANEVKIAFLHLMLKYDMKIDNPAEAEWQTHGLFMFVKSSAKILMRSRTPEIDLDALANEL